MQGKNEKDHRDKKNPKMHEEWLHRKAERNAKQREARKAK
jgi:hypothetical protein